MVNIAIVDDEQVFRDTVKSYMERAKQETTIAYCFTIFDNAFDFFESKAYYDIVFFDIAMPLFSGFDAAKKLRERGDASTIIFLTSLAQYAIKGYEVEAYDFILKPIQYHDFLYRFKKALSRFKDRDKESILLKYKGNFIQIPVEDICYIETVNHIVIVHTTEGVYEARESLKNLESKLNAALFEKCNYSYLLNLKRVDRIEGDKVFLGDAVFYFSRNRKKVFLEKYRKINE